MTFRLIEFARQRDEQGMRAEIERFSAQQPGNVVKIAKAQAYLHATFGRFQEAIDVLSQVIETCRDRDEICHRDSALYRLRSGDFDDSLKDIDIALADTSIIAPRFEEDLRFQRAYIYARIGDTRFESEIAPFSDDHVGRGDQMMRAADLRAIYSQRRR